MDEEIREVLAENEAKRNKKQKPEVDSLKFVTIPIKEYRKLIAKIERQKLQIEGLNKENDNHFKWWIEEENKAKELEEKLAEAQEVIKEYKADYEKLLGIDELKKAQLVELSFEKGVATDAES